MVATADETILAFPRRVPPFQFLDEETLRRVAAQAKAHSFPKGTRILKRGSPASRLLYVIAKGGVKKSLPTESGEDAVVEASGEGELLGVLSVLKGDVIRFGVVAVGDGEERNYIFVLRDITHLVNLDRLRHRAVDVTLQSLRGPLASLISFTDILVDYRWLDDARRTRCLAVMREEAAKLIHTLKAHRDNSASTAYNMSRARPRFGDETPTGIEHLYKQQSGGTYGWYHILWRLYPKVAPHSEDHRPADRLARAWRRRLGPRRESALQLG